MPPLQEIVHLWAGGQERRAWLMSVADPLGLVVDLHGSGLDPRRQALASGLPQALFAAGFALVMPQAPTPFQLLTIEPKGFAWTIPGAPLPQEEAVRSDAPDDGAWIAALVGDLRTDMGSPDLPVLVAGYSGGARLASHLIVDGRVDWAAATLVAGMRHVPGSQRPPPILAIHGRDDLFNPFDGGGGARWGDSVEDAARKIAKDAGWTAKPEISETSGGSLMIHRTPDGVAGLTIHALDGAGHAWPGSTDTAHVQTFMGGGKNIDCSREIAAFFTFHIKESWRV